MKWQINLILSISILFFNSCKGQSDKNILSKEEVRKLLLVSEKEHIPYDKISFNNGTFKKGYKIDGNSKKFNVRTVEDCEEEGDCFTFDRYFINNCYFDYAEYDNGKRVMSSFFIGDNTLKFDYYPELFVGAHIKNIFKYFPATYTLSVTEFLKKMPMDKRKEYKLPFLVVVQCESYKGAYPENMGYLNLVIECDILNEKIKSFEFVDMDQ